MKTKKQWFKIEHKQTGQFIRFYGLLKYNPNGRYFTIINGYDNLRFLEEHFNIYVEQPKIQTETIEHNFNNYLTGLITGFVIGVLAIIFIMGVF